jgi:hypothetical protein
MANRWWMNGNANNAWQDALNWASTEGGAGGAGIPTASDDVFFSDTASSAQCNLGGSTRVCLSIASTTGTTNWTGTLNCDIHDLTVGGGTGAVHMSGTIRIRNGADLRCGAMTFTAGATIDGDVGAKLWLGAGTHNFDNVDFSPTTPIINFIMVGNSNFENMPNTNQFDRWGNNVGIDVTFTDETWTCGQTSFTYGFFGDQNINGQTVYNGVKSTGIWTHDTRCDFSGSGNLISRAILGCTYNNTQTNVYTFTGTYRVTSDSNQLMASNWDNATGRCAGSASKGTIITVHISPGTMKMKNFQIGAFGDAATELDNNTTNPNIQVYEDIDFNWNKGHSIYTKGSGTFSLIGTSGTHNLDFCCVTIEDLSLNCAGATKEIVNDFGTDSLSGSGGTIQSSVPGFAKQITAASTGVMSNCTIKDIYMNAAEKVDAKNGCTNNGNTKGITFEDSFFGMMNGALQPASDPVSDWVHRYRLDGNDPDQITALGSPTLVSGPGYGDNTGYGFEATDALSFDFHSPSYARGTGAFSLAFWWKNDGTRGSIGAICATGNGNTAATFFIGPTSSNQIRFKCAGTNVQSFANPFGEWVHCTVVFAGASGNCDFYINGSLQVSRTAMAYNLTDSTEFTIGNDNGTSSSNPYEGQIDEVRFYNRTLSTTEVEAIYNYKSDLWTPAEITTLAYYDPSDEGSITESSEIVSQINDKSGNNHHMSQSTGSMQPTTWQTVYSGNNMLTFDGDDWLKYIGFPIPTSGNIMFVGVFEITGVTSADEAIFSYDDASSDFEIQAFNASQFDGKLATSASSAVSLTGGPYTGPDVWATVWNFDINTVTIYVNGASVGSTNDYNSKLSTGGAKELIWFADRSEMDSVAGNGGAFIATESVDDTTRQLLEGEMAWKYGIQGNLVASHPYENKPPVV